MYDYREAMTEDVKQWITDEVDLADWTEDRVGLEQQLNDDLWTADSVTATAADHIHLTGCRLPCMYSITWTYYKKLLTSSQPIPQP